MNDHDLGSRPSSLGTILVSWGLVLVPLFWGVYQSLVKSLPLFR